MEKYFLINPRLNVLLVLFQIYLIYTISFEKFNLVLSPNIFVSILFCLYFLILLFLSKFKILIDCFHPIIIIAFIPPFILWLICIYYHNYSIFNPTLMSFMMRFYVLAISSFIIAKTESFLPFTKVNKLNIIFLILNIILMFLSLKNDRNLSRLTFMSISTTSSYVLSVFSIFVHICFNAKNTIQNTCQYIIYFLLVMLSLLTQSRGGLIALLLVLIFSTVYNNSFIFKLNWLQESILQKITLFSSLILFYPILNYSFSDLSIDRINFDFLSGLIGREENLTTYLEEPRLILWREYTNMFISEPDKLFFGIGIPQDQLAYQSTLAETMQYSIATHNYIYGSIAMGGIGYLMSLLILLFLLFKNMLSFANKILVFKIHNSSDRQIFVLMKFIFFSSIINFVCMSSTDNFPYLFNGWPIHVVISIFFFCTGFNSYIKSG